MSSSWPIPTCSAIACGSRCRTSSASACRSPADNGALVVNALDNLSGTDALISVRSRGRFSRPFVVERLQREAETSFRQKEEPKQRLADTEQQLAALQQGADPEKAVELTPEQQATVRQYMQEKLRIRKERARCSTS